MKQYDLSLFSKAQTDEKIKAEIETLVSEIKAVQPSATEICAMYPFYMAYETQIAKKEHYQDIVNAFAEIAPNYLQAELEDKICFLTAVINTMEVMAQPMFEHYMALAEMFKETLKTIDLSKTKNEALAAAVRKACAMKVILAEKYLNLL